LKAALGASVTTGAGASVCTGAGASVGAGAGWQAARSIEMIAISDIRLNSSLLFMVSFLLRKYIELVRLVGKSFFGANLFARFVTRVGNHLLKHSICGFNLS
jgi:hypothetical protein